MFGKSEKLLNDIDNLLNEHLERKLDSKLSTSFNYYLDQFRDLINHEKDIIQKSANEAIKKIDDATIKLLHIEEIAKSNEELSNEVLNLINEVRKRDAKLERRKKEIQRLKEKNEILHR